MVCCFEINFNNEAGPLNVLEHRLFIWAKTVMEIA